MAYADDLCLLVTGIDPPTLVDAVQEALDAAMDWGRNGWPHISIRRNPSQFCFTENEMFKLPKSRPCLGSAPVRFTDTVRFLGIELQH